jgi:hypothetical protein
MIGDTAMGSRYVGDRNDVGVQVPGHAVPRSHTVLCPRFGTYLPLAGADCGCPRSGVFTGEPKSFVNERLLSGGASLPLREHQLPKQRLDRRRILSIKLGE